MFSAWIFCYKIKGNSSLLNHLSKLMVGLHIWMHVMGNKILPVLYIHTMQSTLESSARAWAQSVWFKVQHAAIKPRTITYGHRMCWKSFSIELLKLINYSCGSYPTKASYCGQVNGFRKAMKNELKTTACLGIISNTNANLINLHIDKVRKTHDDKQLYSITHFAKQTLSLIIYCWR